MVGNVKEVVQRGVVATLEALIQQYRDPGEFSNAGLVLIAR
jgi:hypothetical protein